MTSPAELLLVQPEDSNLRLDKVLTQKFPGTSRTYFQYLIETGHVLINGERCIKRHKPKAGDEIEVCFALTPEISLEPQEIPLDILFEDEDLIVINKKAGMVVHPAPGHPSGTFVNALLFHCRTLIPEGIRPGIVHRLDKDTTGVLVAAKNAFTHQALVELFSMRKVEKLYTAICLGKPPEGLIEAPIHRHPIRRQEMAVVETGKKALSRVTVIAHHQELSLVQVELITGRTHQIRVHLKHVGCPILGDPVYGQRHSNTQYQITRQLLHAGWIRFPHPRTHVPLTLTAPLPEDMEKAKQRFFPGNLSHSLINS